MLHHLVAAVLSALILLLPQYPCQAPPTQVVLDQGTLVGLKVFPDSARSAVYAFLGVPYAQPPVGNLRFAAPRAHTGWNWTLQAKSMRPLCPQLTNTIYDETADGTLGRPTAMDEDCLYLNIWLPEAALRYGNLPVLVIVSGEQLSYDWPRNRVNGLDFAAEGVIVVSVQYRQNIYGWLNADNAELPGNYGLEDQTLALHWLQHNIERFGGNAAQVTLLGHGTSGAPCAFAQWLLSRQDGWDRSAPPFARLILMSGGDIERTLSSKAVVLTASKELIRKLGCQFELRGQQLLSCLRAKSVSDLQKAFESVDDHGNGTVHLGPVLPVPLNGLLTNGTLVGSPPTMMGITSNEGAFFQDYWLELARDGYQAVRAYLNYTVMPRVLRQFGVNLTDATASTQVADTLNWLYFSGEAAVSISHLLNAMQRLVSESCHETPFYRMLEALSPRDASQSTLHAYIFDTNNAMDMRGKVNLFGGASHASDLPLLLGPSLFQQISRRRFTATEEKLCRKLRNAFVNFIKTGQPTPGRIFDGWLPYSRERKFIYSLGDQLPSGTAPGASTTDFERNLPEIEQRLLEGVRVAGFGLSRPNRNEYNQAYQTIAPAGQSGVEGRLSKSNTNYLATNQQDSGYALHLKRVYGFWQVLLPHMARYGNFDDDDGLKDPLKQRMRLLEASADAARYRQGFFAMLGLVAVLLAVLGLCVYLLRTPTGASGFRL